MSDRHMWTDKHRQLWARICGHPFEAAEQHTDFTRRLASEQGWSLQHARDVVEEYRRYCFLCVVESQPLTPSDAVDQAWHLHLLYSRDYWQCYCCHVLQQELHHGPTLGGHAEALRYREQYAEALAAYTRWFGPPPARHWPGFRQRFSGRWQRVDRQRVWLVPTPRRARLLVWAGSAALVVALLALPLTARALPGNPLDWPAGPFLTLYLMLAIASFVVAGAWRRSLRDTGRSSRALAREPDVLEAAWLAGAAERSFDTAITELLARDAITVHMDGRTYLKVDAATLPPPLDAVARQISSGKRLKDLVKATSPWLQSVSKALRDSGLCLSAAAARRAALLPTLPIILVLLFGISKVLLGMSRGKPVGFLILLCLVSAVAALLMASRLPHRSLAGDQLLNSLLERHEHRYRAPTKSDLPLAVALLGTTALTGSAFAAYHHARHPNSVGGEGGSGEVSGGGGCGGCGD